MGFDVHLIGTYLVTNQAMHRLPYRFDWSWPKMTAGYRAHLQAGLKPETYADAMWELSQHTLTVGWYDLDTADLVAAINEAVLEITPTNRWYVTAAGTSETYSCLIRDVEHSEAYSVDVDGRRGTAIDFTLTCTAGWEAEEAEVTLDPTVVPNGPVVHIASGLLGSMPAPFRLSLTNDQAVTGGTFGFRHGPQVGSDWIQDYQGTADATALSGAAASATMDADGTQIGTPETLDTNIMRGWYYACARLKQPDATSSDTTYLARSTVTGSGMDGTQAADSDAVAATVANAWEHVRLGPVPVPGGAVPDVETGTGWSADGKLLDQTNSSSSLSVSVGRNAYGDPIGLYFYQTYTAASHQMITAFEFTVVTAPATTAGWTLLVIPGDGSGGLFGEVRSVPVSSMAVGKHKVSFSGLVIDAGDQYQFAVTAPDSAVEGEESLIVDASSTSVYSGGTAGEMSVGDVAKDLTCAVYGRVQRGFNVTVGIIAANSGGGTVALDTVTLVPADEFAALFDTPHGFGEGLMLDAMDPDEVTAYGTDTLGGIEPADQAKVEYVGMPRIWPGQTAIVYDAHTPGNAAPLAGDAKLWYRPTFRTPYGA